MALTNDFTKVIGNLNSGNTTNIINIATGRGGGMMPPAKGMGMPPVLSFAGRPGGCGDICEFSGAGYGPRIGGHCCEAEYGDSKKGKYDGIANIIDAAGGAIAKIFNPLGMLGGGLFGC